MKKLCLVITKSCRRMCKRFIVNIYFFETKNFVALSSLRFLRRYIVIWFCFLVVFQFFTFTHKLIELILNGSHFIKIWFIIVLKISKFHTDYLYNLRQRKIMRQLQRKINKLINKKISNHLFYFTQSTYSIKHQKYFSLHQETWQWILS